MKVPKYIMRLIQRRAMLAANLMAVDLKLCKWLDKNNVLDSLEDYDYGTGVEMYANPCDSALRIIEASELPPHK